MKPIKKLILPINQIILGDCLEVLKTFPDKSIDLVITDPPYGLNFRSHWPMATNKKDFIENDKPEELVPLKRLFHKKMNIQPQKV